MRVREEKVPATGDQGAQGLSEFIHYPADWLPLLAFKLARGKNLSQQIVCKQSIEPIDSRVRTKQGTTCKTLLLLFKGIEMCYIGAELRALSAGNK